MKKIVLYACFIASSPMYAADFMSKVQEAISGRFTVNNSYSIGHLDTLVLKKAAAEKGLEALNKELSEHVYDKGYILEKFPPIEVSKPNPYVIEQIVQRADKTELANEFFERFDRYRKYEVGLKLPKDKNKLNQEKQHNRISLCTSWSSIPSQKEDAAAKITTMFFDKASVLEALKTLSQ